MSDLRGRDNQYRLDAGICERTDSRVLADIRAERNTVSSAWGVIALPKCSAIPAPTIE